MSANHEDQKAMPPAQFNFQTIFNALRRWWKLALPLGLILGAGAGAAVFYFTQPTYTAASWLLIRAKRVVVLSDVEQEDPRKFVFNQLELMKSPPVLEPIASMPAVASAPEFRRYDNVAEGLKKQLKIHALGQSDYFVIEFTSESPNKAALIVNEVAKAYLELRSRNESQQTERTVELLEQQLAAHKNSVELKRENLRELAKQLTGRDPFGSSKVTKTEMNGKTVLESSSDGSQSPLAALQAKLVASEVEHSVLAAQLKAEKEVLDREAFEPSKTQIEQLVGSTAEVIQLREKIEKMAATMREHERTSANLDRNPIYQRLKQEKAADEETLEKVIESSRKTIKEELARRERAVRSDQIAAIESRLSSIALTRDALQEKFAEDLKNTKEYKGETLDLEFLRADYEREAKVHELIAARILAMRMEQRAPDRVEIFRLASVPTVPDEQAPYKKILLAALGGLLAPFALAVLLEQIRQRVTTKDELEQRSKIRVVGEVTRLPRKLKISRSGRVNEEVQLFEESVNGLRTYLMLVDSMRDFRTLAITSAVSGEGKSSLAAQLAVSVASTTNEKTLLIDGDMRSPDVHKIFGVGMEPGLAELLSGESEIDDVLETNYSDNLHLITAGRLAQSPHRLAGNGRFAELLEELLQRYRFIIIDTPPILPASEALVLASAADAAVLCARRDHSRIDQVVEAARRLAASGAKTMGAVLNGIPMRTYAYYYGRYYYSRNRVGQSKSRPRTKDDDQAA